MPREFILADLQHKNEVLRTEAAGPLYIHTNIQHGQDRNLKSDRPGFNPGSASVILG